MFIILSKIFAFIIYPVHFIFFLFLIYSIIKNIKFLKLLSKLLLFVIVLFIFCGGSSYITNKLLWKLENQIPLIMPETADGIILLGGSFKHLEEPLQLNQSSFNETSDRVIEALNLLNSYPDLKLLSFANIGLIQKNNLNEAKLVELFFKRFGIDNNRIIAEPIARNTYQESIAISKYLHENGGNWILITSAFHMPRAITLFQSRELNKAVIYPYPTDFTIDNPKINFDFHLSNLNKVRRLVHEMFGLIAYRLTGRSKTFFPQNSLIPVNFN